MNTLQAKRKYTEEEKQHLLANLDIEGITYMAAEKFDLISIQLPIAPANSSHGLQIVSKILICIKRARCLEYRSKSET
jgi:hypothetical protein